LTQLPTRFEVDTTMPVVLNSVLIEVDQETGRALKIERIQIIDDQLDIQGD
jgi:calcineurin-like phosphoesterase